MHPLNKFFRSLLAGLACIALLSGNSFATTQTHAEKTVKDMLAAVQKGNYESFMSRKSDSFRNAITKENFQGINTALGTRLKIEHNLHYFGSLNRAGHEIFLWKIMYKDGGDDTLVILAFNDKGVSGFWYK